MRAAGGYRARLYGLNSVGLRPAWVFCRPYRRVKKAYDLLFRSGHRAAEAIRLAKEEFKGHADVAQILAFMEGTKRGVSRSVGTELEDEETQ